MIDEALSGLEARQDFAMKFCGNAWEKMVPREWDSPSSVGHAKKTGWLKSSLKPVFHSPLPMRGDASGDLAQHGQCSQMGECCQSPCLSSMVFPLQAVSGKKGDVQWVLHGFAACVHASKIAVAIEGIA